MESTNSFVKNGRAAYDLPQSAGQPLSHHRIIGWLATFAVVVATLSGGPTLLAQQVRVDYPDVSWKGKRRNPLITFYLGKNDKYGPEVLERIRRDTGGEIPDVTEFFSLIVPKAARIYFIKFDAKNPCGSRYNIYRRSQSEEKFWAALKLECAEGVYVPGGNTVTDGVPDLIYVSKEGANLRRTIFKFDSRTKAYREDLCQVGEPKTPNSEPPKVVGRGKKKGKTKPRFTYTKVDCSGRGIVS